MVADLQIKGRTKIGVLETGRNRPELEQRFGTFTDSFRVFLDPHEEQVEFQAFMACDGELPDTAASCDSYIITGSAASVYEDLPWIAPLERFVRDAAQTVPVVGICFGHQLIAQAYGGKVQKAEAGWGVGAHYYDVTDQPGWMSPAADRFGLIVSHQDQVVVPPTDAKILASSTFCPFAMMQIGPNVMSMQPHPEAPRNYAEAIYRRREDILGSDTVADAVESMKQETHEPEARAWIMRFLCREQ